MMSPLKSILKIAQQPPFYVSPQEYDKFVRAITALYEQKAKEDREALLLEDCKNLIFRHRKNKGNEQMQYCIEGITLLLLAVANGLNTRLPENIIKQYQHATDKSGRTFYKLISSIYIGYGKSTDIHQGHTRTSAG